MRFASLVAGLLLVTALQSAADAQMLFGGSRTLSGQTATLNWLTNRPTVSPYVNLARTDNISGGATNYQLLVRPQLEARRRMAMEQQREQQRRMQQAVNSLSRQSVETFTRRDPRQRIPTGHPTQFGSYLQYYPSLSAMRRP